MDTKLSEILEKSKSLSDIARFIFGKENYTNREKCKKILAKNEIDWEEWLKRKKEKPKKYCLYCGKEINSSDKRKKFCNSSCAASYNNIGVCRNKKSDANKNRFCLNCGKELKHQKRYCSYKCQNEYRHKEYIRQWKNGEENGMSGPSGISCHIRRYFFEKYNCKCQECGWGIINTNTGKIPLQLHHIDGDSTNNAEENLQLLCPNCHSLTETFGSIKNHKSKRVDRRTKYYKVEIEEDLKNNITEVSRCVICGKKLEKWQTTYCSISCANRKRIKDITKEQILNIFRNNEKISYGRAAKLLNISQTCLSNKCEKFGIKTEIQKMRFGM